MPRAHQNMSTLNALPENQLLATGFCTVLGRTVLCNSSGLKLGVSHTLPGRRVPSDVAMLP